MPPMAECWKWICFAYPKQLKGRSIGEDNVLLPVYYGNGSSYVLKDGFQKAWGLYPKHGHVFLQHGS
jgi:hypothetical protein